MQSPRRINGCIAGATKLIDDNTIPALQARITGQHYVGNCSHPNDQYVGFVIVSV